MLYVCSRKKMFTDTHTHLYLDRFDEDREAMVDRALEAGVSRMFLPNIDSTSVEGLLDLCRSRPGVCFPMMGLHPTSVRENFRDELEFARQNLDLKGLVAIGECGIDLYWDKTRLCEQEEVFRTQIRWARELDLPLVIHARDSFPEIFRILDDEGGNDLKGVFHSFTGQEAELEKALSLGFMVGINGIVTFRNSGLDRVVKELPPDRLLLETDAPFLAPHPHRGKRNESAYLVRIAEKAAEIYNLTVEEIGRITTENALRLFNRAY